ncbi:MAG TPA: MBL fold metallo-hydrolase [bacterium]|nr:MBL fold metallo-hydrolase [bacterium]
MRVEVWGARGSVPSSHAGNVRYGGNTSCVEIRTRSNDHIILDAGTGIRRLGVRMLKGLEEIAELEEKVDFVVEGFLQNIKSEKSEPLKALEGTIEYGNDIHLFLSHFHWDHIQGFPFFIPAYIPGKKLNIYGQLKTDHRIYDVLRGQMGGTYFPADMDRDMGAEKFFHEIVEDTFRIGDAIVTSRYLNHPQGCLGYRVQCGEMVVAYCTDSEHAEGSFDDNILELADGADIFFYDCQYTPDEYEAKRGWGHSTWEQGIKLAREARAEKLVMFHHDPEHDDDFISRMEKEARKHFPNLIAAHEGMVLADFPENATPDPEGLIEYGAHEEKETSITKNADILKVECGANLETLAAGHVWEKLYSYFHQGITKVIFDCRNVRDASGKGLVALADTIRIASDSRVETEIFNTNRVLLRKLDIARFGQVTTLPRKTDF